MNIKEREKSLSQIGDMSRLTGNANTSCEQSNSKFDWDGLTRPPIQAYLPFNAIQELNSIVSSVRLMNKPAMKYDMENKLLLKYGFKPLNSGTNRRAFYHVNDPGIVIKLASDNVGRSDNISEFNLQSILKPNCPKTFDVTPDGLIALVERVEPMSESDYKDIYGGFIFDFIYTILREGFVMEDVGGNFYKNWGIRYGFGPVILDYPYIYELDWAKLRCRKLDHETNIVCNGWLDYDYDKGLSEIVCTKCGARYSAKYLAKLLPSKSFNEFNRKKESKVSLINVNLKGFIVEEKSDGTIVSYKDYEESETRKNFNRYRGYNNNTKQKSYNNTNTPKKEGFKDDKINRDCLEFAYSMGNKYGWNVFEEICSKLCIDRNVANKYKEDKKKPKKIETVEAVIETPKENLTEIVKEEESKETVQSQFIDFRDLRNKYNDVVNEHKMRIEEVETIPKKGLFPMEPKTSMQIEQERLKNDSETAPYGLIGEIGVEKVKRERLIPELNKYFKDNLDYKFIAHDDDNVTIKQLTKIIESNIKDKLNSISTRDVNQQIEITKTVDRRNKPCFKVRITALGVTFLEYYLHEKGENTTQSSDENKSDLSPLESFEKELIDKEEMNNAQQIEEKDKEVEPVTEEEKKIMEISRRFNFNDYSKIDRSFRTDISSFIINELSNRKEESIPYAKAMKIAKSFVDKYYQDSEEKPCYKGLRNVADEL